ncbi:thiamine pyrophosphate-binding protein [Comamonadaceae bacterium G21597-S1]|nr:thiamine pyrophosphate-binding protein [Comamonadaceae bacterium G21597-S1]
MSKEKMGPWQAVVEALKHEGVTHVFGLPGNPKHLVNDLMDHSDIEFVLMRDEKSAVACAYAWGRLTGQPGVVFSNPGPGITNLVTGLLEATCGSVPMVAIANGVVQHQEGMGAFQELDSRTLMRPVTKWMERVADIRRVPWVMRRAFATARSGRPGAVYVELPSDLADQQCDMPAYAVAPAASRCRPDAERLAEAVTLLRQARQPVIVCGAGAVVSGAADEVARLADRLAAAVMTTPGGRGIYPEDGPHAMGQIGLYFTQAGKAWYDDADVLLVLGSRLEAFSTNSWSLYPKNARLVQVDVDPMALDMNWRTAVGVTGDVRLSVRDMLAELDRQGHARDPARADRLAGASRAYVQACITEAREPHLPIRTRQVLESVNRIFGHDTILMKENGAADLWCYYWPYYRVLDVGDCVPMAEQTAMGMGAIGAIGAKLARPHKQVVCFVGDGAMQMSIVELATASERRCGVTWVVLNNQAFGWVQYNQVLTKRPLRNTGFEVGSDFAAIARAQGCHGITVTDPAMVDAAVQEAQRLNQEGTPVLIDVRIAKHDYSDHFVAVHHERIDH